MCLDIIMTGEPTPTALEEKIESGLLLLSECLLQLLITEIAAITLHFQLCTFMNHALYVLRYVCQRHLRIEVTLNSKKHQACM